MAIQRVQNKARIREKKKRIQKEQKVREKLQECKSNPRVKDLYEILQELIS